MTQQRVSRQRGRAGMGQLTLSQHLRLVGQLDLLPGEPAPGLAATGRESLDGDPR
jgi:hypothetical protein